MKLSQNRQAIMELFEEKERSLTIDEILKGLSRPRDRYQAVKQTLHRMVQDEQIVRLRRGRYAASGVMCRENSMNLVTVTHGNIRGCYHLSI